MKTPDDAFFCVEGAPDVPVTAISIGSIRIEGTKVEHASIIVEALQHRDDEHGEALAAVIMTMEEAKRLGQALIVLAKMWKGSNAAYKAHETMARQRAEAGSHQS